MSTKRKNVFVIVLDGMRADRMGCYGHTRATSPVLDRFAERSTVCLNNYTVGHNSTQSHVSLFTGVHPQFHGAADNFAWYDGRLPTLPKILREDGYHTYGISTDYPPFRQWRGMHRGYGRYVCIEKSKSFKSDLARRVTKGIFGKARSTREILLNLASRTGYDVNKYYERFYLSNDNTGQLLVDTLTKDMERFPKDRPFFVFANILETHAPYLAPKAFREVFGKVTVSDRLRGALFSYSDRLWVPDQHPPLSDEEKETLSLLYDCTVRYSDYLVGQLLATLERQGWLEDSLVVFTADHGGMLAEQENRVGPIRNTYQGIMKTPLIVYSPTHRMGRREERLTSLVDVFSTVLAETGSPNDCKFNYQGRNVLSGNWDREFVVCEVTEIPYYKGSIERKEQIEAILPARHVNRTMIFKDKKFIWRSNGKHLFFDLKQDPKETANLFPHMRAQQYKELMQKMSSWYESQLDSDKPFCPELLEYSGWDAKRYPNGPKDRVSKKEQDPDAYEIIADKPHKIVAKPL